MNAETSRCFVSVVGFGLVLLLGGAAASASEIRWRSGSAPLLAATAEQIEEVLANSTDGTAGPLHMVVGFDRPLEGDYRARLTMQGLTLLDCLGESAYFAAVDPRKVATLASIPELTGISPIRPEWKLHPLLLAGQIPDWARGVDPTTGAARVAVYVVFHPDVDLNRQGIPLAASFGGVLCGTMRTINSLVLELPEEAIPRLAAEDAVQWIEPPLPMMEGLNDGARAQSGADLIQAPPYGLTGAGITVLVFDAGTARSTHADFQGRLFVLDNSGTYFHPTHVAGTIGGGGVANPTYRGMAPGVTMLSYGFEVGGSGGLYTNPGDLEGDYRRAIGEGAVISNNSIGVNVETGSLPCSWQGDYGVTDALIDNIVRGSLGAPFRVVWAGGNERQASRCDVEGFGDYYSIPPPCGAKNHITVGAVNSNNAAMTTFSSWGPTDDGRLKPDLVAAGCQSGGDGGIRSCTSTSDTAYATYCGTSHAAPVVCGVSALLLQDFRAQFPGQPLPRNSTLKALLAQTASDLGNTGPDYMYGYGLVRAQHAIDLMRAGGFDEGFVTQGGVRGRTVTVAPDAPELRITLAWDDAPGTPNVSPALVNDLDLRVFGPDGTRYYPWKLDPLAPSAPAVRTAEDHLNNIEQVFVENPAPGEWTIEVSGYSVPEGPQPFSLAGDGAVNVVTVFSFPNGRPDLVAAGARFDLDVAIACYHNAIVPDTELLHYRVNGGALQTIPLAELSPGRYRVTLPARQCGEVPEYYFSVQTTELGVVTEPASAPAAWLRHGVGAWAAFFEDDFEEDRGWTVFAGADSGNWERADPVQVTSSGVITQPEDDHTPDPGHLCCVTGAAGGSASANDVDGGPSHLFSPIFDLTGTDALISYWRWFHISVQMDDMLVVAVTNNGTEWVTVEEVVRTEQSWIPAEWRVSDYVAPTATVQVRFTIHDTDPGSVLESLVDDFLVRVLTCQADLRGDLNCDSAVDAEDIAPFVLALIDPAGYGAQYPQCDVNRADCNADAVIDGRDIQALVEVMLLP